MTAADYRRLSGARSVIVLLSLSVTPTVCFVMRALDSIDSASHKPERLTAAKTHKITSYFGERRFY